MINKIFVNSTLISKFLKFIFFIRYLLFIFIASFFIFLFFPKVLDHKKNFEIINKNLINNYNLNVKTFDSINYQALPSPRLVLTTVSLNFGKDVAKLEKGKLIICLNLKEIYRPKKIVVRKLHILESKIRTDISNFKNFTDYFSSLENKLSINNSEIFLYQKDSDLINIKKFNISNFKKRKIDFDGYYLNEKIVGKYSNNKENKKINVTIKNLGTNAEIYFDKKSKQNNLIGKTKIKILESHLKFNFILNDKLKIQDSNFRNKILATTFNGKIDLKPFLNFDLILNIKKINKKKINKKNLHNILIKNKLINKINGKITFIYNRNINKKRKLIKKSIINLSLENGNLIINESQSVIKGATLNLSGDFSKFDNYRKLNFKVLFDFNDINNFLKHFSITTITKNNFKQLNVEGSYNVVSNRINFDKIWLDNSVKFNDEDLGFYKRSFEKIFNQNDIFDFLHDKKIKAFINEIN